MRSVCVGLGPQPGWYSAGKPSKKSHHFFLGILETAPVRRRRASWGRAHDRTKERIVEQVGSFMSLKSRSDPPHKWARTQHKARRLIDIDRFPSCVVRRASSKAGGVAPERGSARDLVTGSPWRRFRRTGRRRARRARAGTPAAAGAAVEQQLLKQHLVAPAPGPAPPKPPRPPEPRRRRVPPPPGNGRNSRHRRLRGRWPGGVCEIGRVAPR